MSTNIEELKEGYTWGKVIQIHSVGEYDIVEAHPWQRQGGSILIGRPDYTTVSFHGWVKGRDTAHCWGSLDEALAGCIAYKHEGANHRADVYFIRAISAR